MWVWRHWKFDHDLLGGETSTRKRGAELRTCLAGVNIKLLLLLRVAEKTPQFGPHSKSCLILSCACFISSKCILKCEEQTQFERWHYYRNRISLISGYNAYKWSIIKVLCAVEMVKIALVCTTALCTMNVVDKIFFFL